MVKIYCDTIDDELREAARKISKFQKEGVMLITLTGITEVHHEEAEAQEDFSRNQKKASSQWQ